jgi:light-regulated signal transduction histidine kinase (bacteriophytochrome)
LQEPLRKIQTFVSIILEKENKNLSDKGKYNLQRTQSAAGRMRRLIEDLLAFSRINTAERKFEKTDLAIIVEEVKAELKDTIQEKHATIDVTELCTANIIAFQFRQLLYNLISNALKFSRPGIPPHILIKSSIEKGSELNGKNISPEKNYCHVTIKDNGIGFEPHFNERIFEVFQKLHGKDEYAGTGVGLAIVKKIVENHNGAIIASGELGKGAAFDIYIPVEQEGIGH